MTEDAKTLERFPFTDSSPKVDEITKALFDVQVAMPLLDRTSKNDFHKSRYADLAEYWETAKPILLEHNIVTAQETTTPMIAEGGVSWVTVRTVLFHVTSGQWIANTFSAPYKAGDPKGAGSAETYARRYGMEPMTMTVQRGMDDDGNRANGDRPSQSSGTPPPHQNGDSTKRGTRAFVERNEDQKSYHVRRCNSIFAKAVERAGDEPTARRKLKELVQEVTDGGVYTWTEKSIWFLNDDDMKTIEARVGVEAEDPRDDDVTPPEVDQSPPYDDAPL